MLKEAVLIMSMVGALPYEGWKGLEPYVTTQNVETVSERMNQRLAYKDRNDPEDMTMYFGTFVDVAHCRTVLREIRKFMTKAGHPVNEHSACLKDVVRETD